MKIESPDSIKDHFSVFIWIPTNFFEMGVAAQLLFVFKVFDTKFYLVLS